MLALLDYPSYFTLLDRPLPSNKANILTALEEDRLIRKDDAGTWDVANLGAILFAKRLADFGPLGRKTVRVIVYDGPGRLATLKEHDLPKGYAAGFEGLITLINGLIPANEVIGQALRKTVPMYPELAARELVANALIHQDFFVTGASFRERAPGTRPRAISGRQPLPKNPSRAGTSRDEPGFVDRVTT